MVLTVYSVNSWDSFSRKVPTYARIRKSLRKSLKLYTKRQNPGRNLLRPYQIEVTTNCTRGGDLQ